MCGICGIIRFRNDKPDLSAVKRMLGSLNHRGPDGTGLYYDHSAAIGHTRLSIIDIAGGIQPMSNENSSLWLSFNGEIYNYRELRKELESKGHIFRTSSDSEVILHSWEQWGPACLRRFNGQWAFAIWDKAKRKLHLSVDPYGIRPLYFSTDKEGISFGSEIKTLFQNPGIHRELDTGGLGDVYSTWGLTSDRTCFKGIRRIMPGSLMTVTERGSDSTDYRSPALTEPVMKKTGDSIEMVREALLDSVDLRFSRSDVPVGAYLSGGLDSSIIVSLITRHTDVNLKTFSIRFGEAEYDEGNYQLALSRELGTDHQSVHVNDNEMMQAFPDVIRHTEQPILRTAPIPMFLLSRLVHGSGYKVVVTGEGADEFFAGYDIFKETMLRDAILSGLPEEQIESMLLGLYPWMSRSPGSTRGMSRSFFERNLEAGDPYMSHRTRWDNGTALQGMLNPDRDHEGFRDSELKLPVGFDSWSPLYRAQWLEIRTLLNGYLLSSQGDRMLMANSVEGRFPFLDPSVTALANSLNDSEKLASDYTEKSILKKAFAEELPESILSRPKQPYRAPDALAIFSGKPQVWMEEVMSRDYIKNTGVLNTAMVDRLFTKCRNRSGERMSNRDNMMAVGAVSTLLLHKLFIEDPSVYEPVKPDVEVNGDL